MFIRTERLFLRPSWPEDWAELYAAINDEGVVRNLASAPWPYGMDDAIAFARRPQEPVLPHFLVTLPSGEGSRVIGCIGLAQQGADIELGYWIARSHWGQGYATEAARAVMQLARVLGHSRLVASHFADNPASGRVLVKAGFQLAGAPIHRFSRARGEESQALPYAAELGRVCDCDDDKAMMRAA